MHIPGKRDHSKRNPLQRFFTRWATIRRMEGHKKLIHPRSLMKLPNAQQVAQIAATKRRLASWAMCCEQANEIAARRQLERLGLTA